MIGFVLFKNGTCQAINTLSHLCGVTKFCFVETGMSKANEKNKVWKCSYTCSLVNTLSVIIFLWFVTLGNRANMRLV